MSSVQSRGPSNGGRYQGMGRGRRKQNWDYGLRRLFSVGLSGDSDGCAGRDGRYTEEMEMSDAGSYRGGCTISRQQ